MSGGLRLSIDPQLLPVFPAVRLGGFVAHLDRLRGSTDVFAVMRMCHAAALRHIVPLGAFDLDAMPRPAITLRHARPRTDWFVPLGACPTDVPLCDDAIVLAAGSTVLGWGLRLRESRQTCLCPRTKRAAFVSETVASAQAAAGDRALDELRRRLREAGAIVGAAEFADALKPIADLTCANVP
jgi:DNA/RNA-binding domain of Phe-tRNA-synthetase-like protein